MLQNNNVHKPFFLFFGNEYLHKAFIEFDSKNGKISGPKPSVAQVPLSKNICTWITKWRTCQSKATQALDSHSSQRQCNPNRGLLLNHG